MSEAYTDVLGLALPLIFGVGCVFLFVYGGFCLFVFYLFGLVFLGRYRTRTSAALADGLASTNIAKKQIIHRLPLNEETNINLLLRL